MDESKTPSSGRRWPPLPGMTRAKIISGRLESEGISTKLHYEAAGAIDAITIDGLGEVRISFRSTTGKGPARFSPAPMTKANSPGKGSKLNQLPHLHPLTHF